MKAVIFDLDGTLLDSMSMWKGLVDEFFIHKGLATIPNVNSKVEKFTITQAAMFFSKNYPLEMSAQEILMEWQEYINKHYNGIMRLKPFSKEYIEKLHNQNIKMCIATLSEAHNAKVALSRLGVYDKFEFIITANDVGKSKEFPDIYNEAARRLDASVDECLVYEDSLYAAKTAMKAGFAVCGVYDSFCRDELEMKKLCNQYIYSFEELL